MTTYGWAGTYQGHITDVLARTNIVGVDARHIEAWMRSEHEGVLDGVSRQQFELEAVGFVTIVRADPHLSERLAASYGL